jgi:hypothetical protein
LEFLIFELNTKKEEKAKARLDTIAKAYADGSITATECGSLRQQTYCTNTLQATMPLMDPFFIFISAAINFMAERVTDLYYPRVEVTLHDLYTAYVAFWTPFVQHQFWEGFNVVMKASLLPKANEKLHEARLRELMCAQKNPYEFNKLHTTDFSKRIADEFKDVINIHKTAGKISYMFSIRNVKTHLVKNKPYQVAYDELVNLSTGLLYRNSTA